MNKVKRKIISLIVVFALALGHISYVELNLNVFAESINNNYSCDYYELTDPIEICKNIWKIFNKYNIDNDDNLLMIGCDKEYILDSSLVGNAIGIVRNLKYGYYDICYQNLEDLQSAKVLLESDPNIEYVEKNEKHKYIDDPIQNNSKFNITSTLNIDDDWGVKAIKIREYIENLDDEAKNREIKIAVLDSGINYNHPLFQGRLEKGYDFINDDDDPMDDEGHGTHVAGIIANALQGLNYKIIPYKVLDKKGFGGNNTICSGIERAIKDGCSVINMSLGGVQVIDEDSQECKKYRYHSVIENALNSNICVVASAGNDNIDVKTCCPSHIQHRDEAGRNDVICVGSAQIVESATTGRKIKKSYSSNYGSLVDVYAPGEDIISAGRFNNYVKKSGTSMAAPFVSAMAAVYKAENPSVKCREIEDKIKENAYNFQRSFKNKDNIDVIEYTKFVTFAKQEDEKYIVIDNDEDLEEKANYVYNWYYGRGTGDIIMHGNSDYSYSISFIVQSNLKYEDIKNILSKYDTKYLFGYNYTKDFLLNELKKYLKSEYTESEIEKLYNNFEGDEKEFFEYLKHVVAYNYFSTEKSNSDDICDIYSVKNMNFDWNGESTYYVRFANEEDYLNVCKEFEGNENIEIFEYYSSNTIKIKENSIIIQYSYYDSSVAKDAEVDIVDDIKNTLKEYKINYTLYSSSELNNENTDSNILMLSDIDSEDFEEIYNIVYDMITSDSSSAWLTAGHAMYGAVDDKSYLVFNLKFDWKSAKPKDRTSYTEYLKLGYKNSDKYVITKNSNTFFNSLNDNSVIYPVEDIELKTIYRLYNKHTGEHLFTSKKSEYDKLEKKGWTKEGETFNGCNDKDAKGVYRVYNPNAKGGDHHYTKSYSEAEKLVGKGWKWDNNGGPLFYAAGDKKVYRLYNKVDGRHHYTPKVKEKEKLVGLGWVDEGVAWETLE